MLEETNHVLPSCDALKIANFEKKQLIASEVRGFI
jgi:hypothetical protein